MSTALSSSLCRLHNHLNWSSDRSLAVTCSSGWATCKYLSIHRDNLYESTLMANKEGLKCSCVAFQNIDFSNPVLLFILYLSFAHTVPRFFTINQTLFHFSTEGVSAGGVKHEQWMYGFICTAFSYLPLQISFFCSYQGWALSEIFYVKIFPRCVIEREPS